MRAWIEAVVPRGAACAVCGSRRTLEGHHVVSQHRLKRIARARGVAPADLLWAPEVGLCVCERCHSHHELAFRRIPRRCLTEANLAFARALGEEPFIERTYIA